MGKIHKDRSHSLKFTVISIKDLQVVIQHFDKYPLRSQKLADYILFKQAYNIILNKEHLTLEGLKRLVSIKGSVNKGLSPLLKSAFPDSIKTKRPLVSKDAENIPDPYWIAGFTNGVKKNRYIFFRCFFIQTIKSSNLKLGSQILLKFQLTQHSRDEKLMQNFVEYFECGKYYSVNQKEAGHFVVYKFSDIYEKILPFFNKYEIIGEKGMIL